MIGLRSESADTHHFHQKTLPCLASSGPTRVGCFLRLPGQWHSLQERWFWLSRAIYPCSRTRYIRTGDFRPFDHRRLRSHFALSIHIPDEDRRVHPRSALIESQILRRLREQLRATHGCKAFVRLHLFLNPENPALSYQKDALKFDPADVAALAGSSSYECWVRY
jgi:hypothetical protein